jgi:GDP-D-mannose dehydratase
VAIGTLRLLEAFRDYPREVGRETRFYQAGSSEMFWASPPPQNETTPFYRRHAPIPLEQGIASTYEWYMTHASEGVSIYESYG